MVVYWIDPLQDPRWPAFVEKHPAASIFHTRGWLESLRRTYGFVPAVVTSSPPGQALSNGIVFCPIKSWVTGRRLVSLPFTDHCQPLVNDPEELAGLLRDLSESAGRERWKYIELRPLNSDICSTGLPPKWQQSDKFYFHKLSIHPSLSQLFAGFQKDSVQRKIRRAERDRLVYECGRSQSLLNKFYRLQVMTRRRQKLPPQPLAWFRNLVECLGEALTIRVASKGDLPVAGIITINHKATVTYKYGCSDERYHSSGGMQFLFWKMIQEAKEQGSLELDMGRCDLNNAGLIRFKDQWGAEKSDLVYVRCSSTGFEERDKRGARAAKGIFAHMPRWLLIAAGRLLYPHIG